MRFDLVDLDDWNVVYVDNELWSRGHSVTIWEWLLLLEMPFTEVRRWELRLSEDDVFFEPPTFTEIQATYRMRLTDGRPALEEIV